MPPATPEPFDLSQMPEPLRRLAARGTVRQFAPGTLILEEGDRGDSLYLILSGTLRVFSGHDNGREITYGHYGPGEYLGEMGLDGGTRSASVEAVDTARCVMITRAELAAHIAEFPEFAFDLLSKVIRRARAANLGARQAAINDLYTRLKLLLESLSESQFDGTRLIRQRPTPQDLAQRLGCSRELVSRVLKDLEVAAVIRPEFDKLRLLRPLPARW